MEQPTQALIAAGGFGSRMGLSEGKPSSKALIKVKGKTLLSRLLYSLSESNIKHLVVATSGHSEVEVRNEINKGPTFSSVRYVRSEKGFRHIPSEAKHLLDNRFLLVCGHHPLPREHFKKMLSQSRTNELVLSSYVHLDLPVVKKERITFMDGNLFYPLTGGIKTEGPYVRNPFVVSHKVISLSEEDNFIKSFSQYMFTACIESKSYGVVQSHFPPEVDTVEEFERMRIFLGENE